MIPRRSFDPRAAGSLLLWLDDDQSPSRWGAKVGSAATQAATNNRPSLSSRNARPVLSFDGINDTLALPALATAAWHAFVVANPASSTTQTLLHVASSSTQSFTLSSSSSGWALRTASGSPTTAAALYGADSRVGANWSGGALKNFFNGQIGEILVYGAALSSANAAAVSRYLTVKWGL